MSNDNNVVRVRDGKAEVWCPGCEAVHSIDLGMWEMDGSLRRPSFHPEIITPGCVAQIKDGEWRFSKLCGHELAGSAVRMEPIAARQ